MVIETAVKEEKKVQPKFRDPSELTDEQLTDPDYSKKKIARDFGISEQVMLMCSKCHHCR